MDIVEFLTARLDEDEATARAATPGPWRWGDWSSNFGTPERERNALEHAPGYGAFPVVRQADDEADGVLRLMDSLETGGDDYPANGVHIARHDPARVLAEVAAKRAIVAMHELYEQKNSADMVRRGAPEYYRHCDCQSEDGVIYGAWPCDTLKHFAAPYADHPDFDPAWQIWTTKERRS